MPTADVGPLEAKIEADAVRWAKAAGWLAVKLGGAGTGNKRGWPDRLFIRKSVVVFIEFKRLFGKLTPMQERRHAELKAEGQAVFVCRSAEEAIAILNARRNANHYPGCEDL